VAVTAKGGDRAGADIARRDRLCEMWSDETEGQERTAPTSTDDLDAAETAARRSVC